MYPTNITCNILVVSYMPLSPSSLPPPSAFFFSFLFFICLLLGCCLFPFVDFSLENIIILPYLAR